MKLFYGSFIWSFEYPIFTFCVHHDIHRLRRVELHNILENNRKILYKDHTDIDIHNEDHNNHDKLHNIHNNQILLVVKLHLMMDQYMLDIVLYMDRNKHLLLLELLHILKNILYK